MDPSSSLLGESTDLRSRHIVHVHLSSSKTGPFSVADVSSIVRTIASVYLHGLSLHISDAAATGLIAASVELLKAVGLNMFLLSLQDSLQDWMRMLLLHSGARRATVRVQALEFLVLLLRASWTTFGTLSKIRLPALAIFAEVCEKMAQPHLASGHSSIVQALAPILKSLERMEQSTVSRNMAFKAALHRFAGQLHAIYRGFLASVPKQSNNFNEATEEELMAAASCFDKYELPFHRAYWLHLLAELHEERKHFAEAGACRFEIYNTLKASEGHAKVWNPRPFARWEAIHRRSGAYAQNQPRPLDDAELAAEIESNLVYAGELFKLAGSKKAKATFTLAADLFASRFDDDGMRRAYLILSTLDKNKVPILEAHPESPKISNLTGIAVNPSPHAPSDCGTFFRVYFHGSAPDDLVGAEYVYRAPGSMPIEKFGDHVAAVLHGLLPPHVPVDLILDDGRTNQQSNTKGHYIARPSQRRGKVAGGQRLREREGEGTMDGGVCEVKITPLRPVAGRQSTHTTGSKEWFEMRCKTAQHAVNSTSASASAAAPTAAGQQVSVMRRGAKRRVRRFFLSNNNPDSLVATLVADSLQRQLREVRHQIVLIASWLQNLTQPSRSLCSLQLRRACAQPQGHALLVLLSQQLRLLSELRLAHAQQQQPAEHAEAQVQGPARHVRQGHAPPLRARDRQLFHVHVHHPAVDQRRQEIVVFE